MRPSAFHAVSPWRTTMTSVARPRLDRWRAALLLGRCTARIRSIPFLLGARMCCVVDFREVLVVEVCIDLGGGDAGVSEHLLHRAQVSARLQHVRRERVAQHVRMYVLGEA